MSESSSNTTPPHGSISWTEIPVLDMTRAQKFYGDLFGWTFTIMPDGEYTMFAKGATMRGGFVRVTPEHHMSPYKQPYDEHSGVQNVTVTIRVDSVDESLKAIEKAGGKVYKSKMVIPGDNMGCNAYFVDSENNVMGLWSMT